MEALHIFSMKEVIFGIYCNLYVLMNDASISLIMMRRWRMINGSKLSLLIERCHD